MKDGCKRCAKKGSGCWQHPDSSAVSKAAAPKAEAKKAGGYKKGDKIEFNPERHCGFPKRIGGPCVLGKGWGTDHRGIGMCKKHGGTSRNHRVAAQKVMAQRAVATYGLPVEIGPNEAMLGELERTYGIVLWLGAFIANHELDDLVQSRSEKSVKVKRGDGDWELAGVRQFQTRAAPSIWLELYQRERRHLLDVAKTCVACNIMERQTKVVEERGRDLAAGVLALISGLVKAGLIEKDDPRVPGIARAALAAGAMDV